MLDVLSTVQLITQTRIINLLMSTVPTTLNTRGDITISGGSVFAVFPSGHLRAMPECS